MKSGATGRPALGHARRARPAGRASWVVGVEVGASVLRASVFNRQWDLLGKMKLSTKRERGAAAVIDRLERCVRYAVDEADLRFSGIAAVGVALPEGDANILGPTPEAARLQLARRLGRPVVIGDFRCLASTAVGRLEREARSGGLAVVFPGAAPGACLLAGTREPWCLRLPTKAAPAVAPTPRRRRTLTARPGFERFRPRDFRKAIRRGDPVARRFLLESVDAAAGAVAPRVAQGEVGTLILAGGAVDENKEDAIAAARARLAKDLGAAIAGRVRVQISELGDQAALIGAAMTARSRVDAARPPSVAHRARLRVRPSSPRGAGRQPVRFRLLNPDRPSGRPRPTGALRNVRTELSAPIRTSRTRRKLLRRSRNGRPRPV